MNCNRMKPGWTDPFGCTQIKSFGRAKRRIYVPADDVELFGVTTYLESEAPAYAHATWVAQEAVRLFDLIEKKQADIKWTHEWDGTGIQWLAEKINPASRMTVDHLRGEATRRSSAAQDRGHVTEAFLDAWSELGYITADDAEHWLTNKLSEYSPESKPWRCSHDEALPYVMSLRSWLENREIEVLARNVFVLDPDLGYATVIDAWLSVDGQPFSVNVKTAASASRHHAEQLAAETRAKYVLPQGEVEAKLLAPIMEHMRPAILLVTQEGATLRELTHVDHWHKSFLAARERYLLSLAEMPFVTVKETG